MIISPEYNLPGSNMIEKYSGIMPTSNNMLSKADFKTIEFDPFKSTIISQIKLYTSPRKKFKIQVFLKEFSLKDKKSLKLLDNWQITTHGKI